MFSRKYRYSKLGRTRLVRHQYKMTELYFICEGSFGIYHPTLKIKGGSPDLDQPAVLLPRHTVFGDYQILFDTYPRMELSPFFIRKKTSEQIIYELGIEAEVEELGVMCLKSETLNELCDLYPQTAETLKIEGLRKRKLFLDCLKKQEAEAASGMKTLSCLVCNPDIMNHLKPEY